MKSIVVLASAAILAFTPVELAAGNHKAKHAGNKNAAVGNCPPGLAKKNNGCLPPGQAKKYGRGDFLNGDFTRIRNPQRYGLESGESYYRAGDYVYRVDEETREVLDLIGAVGAILN